MEYPKCRICGCECVAERLEIRHIGGKKYDFVVCEVEHGFHRPVVVCDDCKLKFNLAWQIVSDKFVELRLDIHETREYFRRTAGPGTKGKTLEELRAFFEKKDREREQKKQNR